MSTYTSPITRVDTARGHHYVDGAGTRVPGVTTILGSGLPKAALVNWAGKATAEYALDHWDELAQLSPAKRLETLQKARYAERDAAAKRGTEVHALAERLVKGEEVDVPDELAGHVESYVQFLDAFQPEPLFVEFSVASYRHGYAGTGDLIAWFPTLGQTLLCDIKTNKSGIYGETALQLAAYRYADVMIDADGERDMPAVDGCAAIHVRADGADLIPVTAEGPQMRQFLYVQQVAEFNRVSRDLIGAPVEAPGRARRRRLEVIA